MTVSTQSKINRHAKRKDIIIDIKRKNRQKMKFSDMDSKNVLDMLEKNESQDREFPQLEVLKYLIKFLDLKIV